MATGTSYLELVIFDLWLTSKDLIFTEEELTVKTCEYWYYMH